MAKENFSVVNLVNSDGCFDLQFRKDTRHERTNSPTYYRWKAQFIVTSPKDDIKILQKIKKEMGCGKVNFSKNQARFAVQKIDEIFYIVIPYLRKNFSVACLPAGRHNKKKDFELWAKGVELIHKNKGKALAGWKKGELSSLIEIQKSGAKYKNRPRPLKWLSMARAVSRVA